MFYVFLNEDLKATAPLSHPQQRLSKRPSGIPRPPSPHSHYDPKNLFLTKTRSQAVPCPLPQPAPSKRGHRVVIVAWRVPQPHVSVF